MAQSVSNDALWEKLSEMDKKFEELIKSDIHTLGLSNDSHFEANRKNIQLLNENIFKTWKVVSQIRKQQKESNEVQKNDGESCFNFKFFKVRKTSFIITILGLLVFILTLFCMKQQNDYSLLIDEYYRQSVGIEANN
ncbi:MAG: hypothetical protein LBU51_07385 [Bacteroidales bacterium]|jgi:hypothetical protein|nr:hypothetical protein [Bacteroidales bacterium]